MKLAVIGALLVLTPTVAAAQYYQPYQRQQPVQPRYGSTYDPQSQTRYNYNTDSDGTTTVRGYNYQTGSQWRSTIQPNGDQSGTDSRGNLWRYNSENGNYMSTDGTICVGRGATRVCSGGPR